MPSAYVGLITEHHPVDRVVGDYTVVLGNATWTLRGIAFDSPLPPITTSTHFAYYEWRVGTPRPSARELATMPPIVPATW